MLNLQTGKFLLVESFLMVLLKNLQFLDGVAEQRGQTERQAIERNVKYVRNHSATKIQRRFRGRFSQVSLPSYILAARALSSHRRQLWARLRAFLPIDTGAFPYKR